MRLFNLAAATLGLAFVSVPAQAEIHSIKFTAEGVTTITGYCLDGPCTFEKMPAPNTPWTFSFEWSLDPSRGNSFDLAYHDAWYEQIDIQLPSGPIGLFAFSVWYPLEFIDISVKNGKLQHLRLYSANDSLDYWLKLDGDTISFRENVYPLPNYYGDGFVELFAHGSGQITFLEVAGPIPEPTTWAMLIAGFGLVGTAARRQRRTQRV